MPGHAANDGGQWRGILVSRVERLVVSVVDSDGHGCPMGIFWQPRTRTHQIPIPCPQVQDSCQIPLGTVYI